MYTGQPQPQEEKATLLHCKIMITSWGEAAHQGLKSIRKILHTKADVRIGNNRLCLMALPVGSQLHGRVCGGRIYALSHHLYVLTRFVRHCLCRSFLSLADLDDLLLPAILWL